MGLEFIRIMTHATQLDQFISSSSIDDPPETLPKRSNPISSDISSYCDNQSLDEIISSVGSFRRLIIQPDPITASYNIGDSSEYERISNDNIKRRKLKFNDDALSETFIDAQTWRTGNFSSIEEVIERYKQCCMEFKIRPCVQLLDQLSCMDSIFDPLDELHMRGVRLDTRQVEALDEVLRHVRCNIINFSKCSLDDDMFISICEMIEYYQMVKLIILAHNPKIKIRGWIHLGRMLRKCSTIEQLDIGYCAIDNFSLPMFLRCIRANCCLKVLHLEGNGLSGKGIMILLAALKFNTNLKELYLGRNNLNTDDSLHIAAIIKNNPHLQVLDLRDNSIQDRGLNHLVNSMIEKSEYICLNSLFLTNNNISEGGMEDISIILEKISTLNTLSLSGNTIGNNGIQMLKPALLTNNSLAKFGLRNSKITCEGAIAIAEVLAESRIIEVLDLRGNDIRIAGLMALSLAHKVNHYLLNLQIPENIKADQRDRQLIIDVLNDLVNYRIRNHTQREAMFIAKSMEESLNIDENEVSSLIADSCGKHKLNSQFYGVELNSSLEVNRNFTLNSKLDSFSSMQLDGGRFLHGNLKLTEDSVLTVDPDALSNYQTSEECTDYTSSIADDISVGLSNYEGKVLNRLDYKPLPDLLDEIPIARERHEYQRSFLSDDNISSLPNDIEDNHVISSNLNEKGHSLQKDLPDINLTSNLSLLSDCESNQVNHSLLGTSVYPFDLVNLNTNT